MVFMVILSAMWSYLVNLAHQTTPKAIHATNKYFGWAILLTYLLTFAWCVVGSRQRRRIFFRWTAVTLVISVTIGAAELAAAADIVDWRSVFGFVIADGSINKSYSTAYVTDRRKSFRRVGGVSWSGVPSGDIELAWSIPASAPEPITITYDARGYRNPTMIDQADVVVIGDSYSDGWYVSDEQVVSRRLSRRLNRPVANFSVAGYGTMQELIVLKDEAVTVRPKAVVWFFFEGNDLYNDQEFEDAMLYIADSDEADYPDGKAIYTENRSWWPRSFTRNVLRVLRHWSAPLLPSRVQYFGRLSVAGVEEREIYFTDYASVEWSDWIEQRSAKALNTIADAAAYCRERDIHFLVCYVPIKYRVYRDYCQFDKDSPCREWTVWPLPGRFAEYCGEQNIAFIDLTPHFTSAVASGGMPYAAVDTHWSAEGHELVAQIVNQQIDERGWLID